MSHLVKTHLSDSARLLADLCERIDSGEEPTTALVSIFNETRLDLAEAIDRRKAFAARLRNEAALFQAASDELKHRAIMFETALEKLKENTKAIMEASPNIPYVDSYGSKLSVVNNSKAKLILDFEIREKKQVSHIVDLGAAETVGISEEYLSQVSFVVLNTEKVRADLEAGKELPWARLERSTHLRGL